MELPPTFFEQACCFLFALCDNRAAAYTVDGVSGGKDALCRYAHTAGGRYGFLRKIDGPIEGM
jgi:hypothetical protein